MSLVDDVKGVASLIQQVASAELKLELTNKMLALQNTALELSEERHRLHEENQELHQENTGLRDRLRLQDEFTERDGIIWKEGVDIPYCLKCSRDDVTKSATQMREQPTRTGDFYCPFCGWNWKTKERLIQENAEQKRLMEEIRNNSGGFTSGPLRY